MPGGGGLGRRRTPGVSAEVNITPLVDVALVLLIIFMITAPIMQGGIDVQLPEAKATPLASNDGVIVTVDKAGDIFIDKAKVSLGEFQQTIRRVVDQKRASGVIVRGDAGTEYKNVIKVVAALNEVGITQTGLAVETIEGAE